MLPKPIILRFQVDPGGSNDPMITGNKCHNLPGEMPENHPAIGKKMWENIPGPFFVDGFGISLECLWSDISLRS